MHESSERENGRSSKSVARLRPIRRMDSVQHAAYLGGKRYEEYGPPMVEVDWEDEAVDRDRRVQVGEDGVTQRRRHCCGASYQVRLLRASRRNGCGESRLKSTSCQVRTHCSWMLYVRLLIRQDKEPSSPFTSTGGSVRMAESVEETGTLFSVSTGDSVRMAELVEAAWKQEWEQVEVRRPLEAAVSSECVPS